MQFCVLIGASHISTCVTEYCAEIAPTLYSATKQFTVKKVTRPLPSLAKWVWLYGTSMGHYGCSGGISIMF